MSGDPHIHDIYDFFPHAFFLAPAEDKDAGGEGHREKGTRFDDGGKNLPEQNLDNEEGFWRVQKSAQKSSFEQKGV